MLKKHFGGSGLFGINGRKEGTSICMMCNYNRRGDQNLMQTHKVEEFYCILILLHQII